MIAKRNLLPADPATVILARTLFGEARGQSVRGKEAVAAVIINRVNRAIERNGYWWGNDVTGVCLKPWQFSCWNSDDPNLAKIHKVTTGKRYFQSCIRIARRAITGALADPTDGATHYHHRSLNPPWARGRVPSAIIGDHHFYADIE